MRSKRRVRHQRASKPAMNGTAEVEELERLQRQKAIEARLAAFKHGEC
jgi:hypothetical protein